ncbi:hypothetical protein ACFV27_01085 [Streptomyces antimycoticus]|uniref:hypothetical protein n=1 Tax=Streptomyces antimycoticus TaxID=68175 RepID=UPI0036973DF9
MPTSVTTSSGVQVCSLKVDTPQLIAPGAYTIVRFPFGAAEPADPFEMHQVVQPDGYVVSDWAPDDRSGLIWPSRYGWGHLHAMIQWEAGGYTELRDQYVRDPLSLGPNPNDTTATEHRPPSIGMQCFVKNHGIYVDQDTPLALRVSHNDSGPRRLLLAEFKLCIYPAE